MEGGRGTCIEGRGVHNNIEGRGSANIEISESACIVRFGTCAYVLIHT